jgi:hypothetical protein
VKIVEIEMMTQEKIRAAYDFWHFCKLRYDRKTWQWEITNPHQAKVNFRRNLRRTAQLTTATESK